MQGEWNEDEDQLAAATTCPMPDCGELALAYRPAEDSRGNGSDVWEFTCPRCGAEFLAFEADLLFRSARKQWFWTGIYSA